MNDICVNPTVKWVSDREGMVITDGIGRLYTLNQMGAEVWKGFADGKSQERVCEAVASRYPSMDQDAIADDVKLFICDLIEKGLLISSVPIVNHEILDGSLRKWLPVRLLWHNAQPRVEWLFMGDTPLADSFFEQTVSRVLRESTPPHHRYTGVDALLHKLHDEVMPSGFIFHVSRCGSTLVSDLMRLVIGTIVISEAAPISRVLSIKTSDNERDTILKAMIRAFGQRRIGDEQKLIVKFASWNILFLSSIRAIWPNVPYLIIIRSPLEVMASRIGDTPFRRKRVGLTLDGSMFGWTPKEITAMRDEEFCARELEAYFRAAIGNLGPRCMLLDYSDLNPLIFNKIASFFGLNATKVDWSEVESCFALYSRHPGEMRQLAEHRYAKEFCLTEDLHCACERWAKEPYLKLRDLEAAYPESH